MDSWGSVRVTCMFEASSAREDRAAAPRRRHPASGHVTFQGRGAVLACTGTSTSDAKVALRTATVLMPTFLPRLSIWPGSYFEADASSNRERPARRPGGLGRPLPGFTAQRSGHGVERGHTGPVGGGDDRWRRPDSTSPRCSTWGCGHLRGDDNPIAGRRRRTKLHRARLRRPTQRMATTVGTWIE